MNLIASMTLFFRHSLCALLLASAWPDAAAATDPPDPLQSRLTLFLVRHAEQAPGEDPSLNALGYQRAQAIAECMAQAGIQAVWATATRRAHQTALPTASRLGLQIQEYDPSAPEGFAAELIAANQSALVIGHSNTLPALVLALGAAPGSAIEAHEYDRLYLVRPATGESRLLDQSQCRQALDPDQTPP